MMCFNVLITLHIIDLYCCGLWLTLSHVHIDTLQHVINDHRQKPIKLRLGNLPIWRVIFGGANIREKLKVAVRINFCGLIFVTG